ncbi:MAG: arylsulfotransferase family protein [Solirubrobacteraceae bacterium]
MRSRHLDRATGPARQHITALDASAEMLAIAASRIRDERVRFIQANIFSWTPDQRYDVVFFGFWLSHVPLDRFEHFWTLVADCLAPEGRVFFVDDGRRADLSAHRIIVRGLVLTTADLRTYPERIWMIERLSARLVTACAATLLCAAATLASPGLAAGAVSVYPIAGDRVASPQTQIAFRGVSVSALTDITVTGSRSGAHAGTVKGDSDGRGGSFLPSKLFTPGETVTVRTGLDIVGASHGTFRFTVADPAGKIPFRPRAKAPLKPGTVFKFRSAPRLQPAAVKVTRNTTAASLGDIFVAPQAGPVSNGPELLDRHGHVVWYQPAPKNDTVTDFRVQGYEGKPVLTWWQGTVEAGSGRGVDLIYNGNYSQIATVRAANGLSADLHEFTITRANTALITAFYPVYWDARSVRRPRHQIVIDGVVQEVDIRTGLVLFQWDSLDHVALSDSHAPLPPRRTRNPFDHFHVNSVDLDDDGNVLISARNTWAAYKVNRQTGAIMWTLGGRHSTFKLASGASFAFQHDVRVRSQHDWYVTVFDNGSGPPAVHKQSRGLELFLDVKHRTARAVHQLQHSPPLSAFAEGNVQQLPNGDDFLGWGAQPFFTEYNRQGRVVFDGHFVGYNPSYRAYRMPWNGAPLQGPAIAASAGGAHTVVYASWNGATSVASWRVLGGSSASSLQPVASTFNHGFETQITSPAEAFVAVQALDARGHVLGQSSAIHPQ